MKKIVCLFLMLALSVSVFTGCGEKKPAETTGAPEASTQQTTEAPATTEDTVPETVVETTAETTIPTEPEEPFSMENALFIGDSRTVGIKEYSQLPSDFFTNVGMSVYNIYDTDAEVGDLGKVSLEELLAAKSYKTIYLMIGINELGYDRETTLGKYEKLVAHLQQMQPDADIFLEANLHVSQSKSDSDSYINNASIDQFNSRIAEFADGESVFYLDVNPVFDDAGGALSGDYTSDGVHLYAKHYAQWGSWIAQESEAMLK